MQEQYDLQATQIKTTQLVIWKFNTWNFYDYNILDLKQSSHGGRYAIMDVAFGVVSDTETNPNNIRVIGAIGDYLFIDKEKNLTVVSKSLGQYYV
jgi:hypothetical protein